MVIRATDRVSAVIARDARLIDVFVAASPRFERLRSAPMRKVMARLVTVEQAARVAGLEPRELVSRLNAALPEDGARDAALPDPPPAAGPPPARDPANASPPPHLATLPAWRIVDLDVRPELERGEEPFSRIMAARRALPDGAVLRLRAIFEPVPLYAVLGRQGFSHWTERLDEDDWRIWFYRTEDAGAPAAGGDAAPVAGRASPETAAGASSSSAGCAPEEAEAGVVVLDVRGLEPPEPLQRTLEALETLPADATLVQLNVREPRFLFPLLVERGWTYEVRHQGDELVRTFIRRVAAP